MAAIQSLRKNSWILTIVIGLALLAFIVTGLDTSLFNSKQSNVIAEIDGEEYTYDEYDRLICTRIEENNQFLHIFQFLKLFLIVDKNCHRGGMDHVRTIIKHTIPEHYSTVASK